MFPNSMEFCVIFPLDIKWIGSKFKTSPNSSKMEHPEKVPMIKSQARSKGASINSHDVKNINNWLLQTRYSWFANQG